MKTKTEIILSYLEKGTEVYGDYTKLDIRIEYEWDRKELFEFSNLDSVIDYCRKELSLEIIDLKKTINSKYFRE